MKNRRSSIFGPPSVAAASCGVVSCLMCFGCNSVGDNFGDPVAAVRSKPIDSEFRKMVEKDPFPTATKAGVMIAKK